LGKDRLLAGTKVNISAGRGGAAARLAVAAAFAAAWVAPNSTESAVANGDTRTIILSDQHTDESGSFTFMVNGVYDQGVLDKLNWFCRDWRLNEPTKMDPHLFDIIWEVYRESGSTQPIDVLSAYRSPQTNAMLRRRSRQVAEHSQHMEGKAIDAHFLDVGTARIRDIAMRMEYGGVGFYPTGITPWVHIDSGSVRYWPRMSRDALTRLFPDGKTVFIPADGQPMPRYEEARAEIEARGGQVQVASGGFGIFSWLFGHGGGADDAEEAGGQEATTASATTGNARGGRSGGGPQAAPQVEVADVGPEAVAKAKRNLPTGHAYAEPAAPAPAPAAKQGLESGPDAVAMAKRDLPTGPAYASAAPAPPVKQEVVAALEQPDVANDASPIPAHGALGVKSFGPLPPRRPADLDVAAALAGAPMPPARPAALILASTGDQAVGVLPPPAPTRGAGAGAAIAQHGLPKVITSGVDTSPTGALALAEVQPAQKFDDSALLARAAELTAPLPPIPSASPPTSAAPETAAARPAQTAPERGVLARLFGSLSFGAFKTAAPAGASQSDLRGAQ
jgi:uncharacterized protein YcbK (DUF882 family)